MEVVLRMLDAKDQPLRMTPDYAKNLYDACAGQLRLTDWTLEEVRPWIEIFLRIDEADFETVARAAEDRKPWKIFLRLNTAMTACLVKSPEYSRSLEAQATHRQLAEGRRRMRVSALCHLDLYGTVEDEELRRSVLADAPATVVDTLESILKKSAKKQA